MRAIPRFLAPSILKSSQRGKFAPEPVLLFILANIFSQKGDRFQMKTFLNVLLIAGSILLLGLLFSKNEWFAVANLVFLALIFAIQRFYGKSHTHE
jgi:hypothetical protein